jgi:hypothetical protein
MAIGACQSPMNQQTAKQEEVCGVLRIELEQHQRYCVGLPHSAPHRSSIAYLHVSIHICSFPVFLSNIFVSLSYITCLTQSLSK